MVEYGDLWRSIITLDEAKFNIYDPDGCHYYWHDLEMEQEDYCSREQASKDHIETISSILIPFPKSHHENHFDFQDSAPIHTSKKMSAMEGPACSVGVNSVKNAWRTLRRQVCYN